MIAYDWMVYVFVCCLCMYRMTIGRLELRIFCIQKNHTIASWNNTSDSHFTQLRFEALQASVIYTHEIVSNPLFWEYQDWRHLNHCNSWTKHQNVMKFWHVSFEGWYSWKTIQNFCWQRHLCVSPGTYWSTC